MSCRAAGTAMTFEKASCDQAEELRLASRSLGEGLWQTEVSVPGIHCGGCISKIEKAVDKLPNVEHARVNLSTKRVAVRWREKTPPPLMETLARLGYEAHLLDTQADIKDDELPRLIRALAVAGFAAMNVMILSVSVWSGAEPATRQVFHWISALIALPALAYSGQVFFRSAWRALRHGRMNMDVPISLGVTLAFGLSLFETVNHGQHAYFDASVSLLFFLLIGRTLDHVMRERARTAVKGLARLSPRGARVLLPDGSRAFLPVDELRPGMRMLIAAGERVPVDAKVEDGASDLDCSLVNGESAPQRVERGAVLLAGTLNLTGPLTLRATAAARDSFLAEMIRLMEAAEGGRARYRRIADRASQLYSPVVHLTALATFAGWMLLTGDWHRAITIAIAVLIITCPCALGLAVPMVQVIAARRLFENGIMVKDGSAMERLAEINTAVFDKTGTLTLGAPRLANADEIDRNALGLAGALAQHSLHPISRGLAAFADATRAVRFERVQEHPGLGLEGVANGTTYWLGRGEWVLGGRAAAEETTVLAENGRIMARFAFEDRPRAGAREALDRLRHEGVAVEILSGDRAAAVEATAAELDVGSATAEALPADKTGRIGQLSESGRKVLMVGDGLNDAPALAAAHVSMAPATGADIGRNAADFVFLHESLTAVPLALSVSRQAGRLIRQNLAFAVAYNAVVVPIAILGLVTPLLAALAMSLSSIMVMANALRLGRSVDSRRPAGASFDVSPALGEPARL